MQSNFGKDSREMVVKRWRVKVYDRRESRNGDYTILKGSTGARRNEAGEYEGGLRVDVMLKNLAEFEESKNGFYLVSGTISWCVNTDCNGVKHNNCTIWADHCEPYVFKKRKE